MKKVLPTFVVGLFKKAAEFYQRSLAVKEKFLVDTDIRLVNLLYKCACVLADAGQTDESRKYKERAEKGLSSVPVNQGLIQGLAKLRVQPQYPREARLARISGSVLVQVSVDECGRVTGVKTVSGHVQLAPAALRAAKEWRFTPTVIKGRPVRVIGTIVFNFTL